MKLMKCSCGYVDDSLYNPYEKYVGTFIELDFGPIYICKLHGSTLTLFGCPNCHNIHFEEK